MYIPAYHIPDYAWKVITEFAEDLLETQEVEKEQETRDEVSEILDRKKQQTLAYKRSFFVRMVSDPKIYNPSIAKTLSATRKHVSLSPENNVTVQPPLYVLKQINITS